MFEGRRQSADMANSRSAQHFQLDQCLSAKAMDKLIYSLTSVVDTRQSECPAVLSMQHARVLVASPI